MIKKQIFLIMGMASMAHSGMFVAKNGLGFARVALIEYMALTDAQTNNSMRIDAINNLLYQQFTHPKLILYYDFYTAYISVTNKMKSGERNNPWDLLSFLIPMPKICEIIKVFQTETQIDGGNRPAASVAFYIKYSLFRKNIL